LCGAIGQDNVRKPGRRKRGDGFTATPGRGKSEGETVEIPKLFLRSGRFTEGGRGQGGRAASGRAFGQRALGNEKKVPDTLDV